MPHSRITVPTFANMRYLVLFNIWLIATTGATGQFIYPDASAANVFHDGDTVNVAYASTFKTPALFQLFCGNSTRKHQEFPEFPRFPYLIRLHQSSGKRHRPWRHKHIQTRSHNRRPTKMLSSTNWRHRPRNLDYILHRSRKRHRNDLERRSSVIRRQS